MQTNKPKYVEQQDCKKCYSNCSLKGHEASMICDKFTNKNKELICKE